MVRAVCCTLHGSQDREVLGADTPHTEPVGAGGVDETQDEGGTDVGTKQTTGKQGEAGKGGAQGGSDADDADDDDLDELLNSDEDDEDEDDEDGDDEDGDGDAAKGDKPKGKSLSAAAVTKLLADQQAKFNSELDRRINQVVRKLKPAAGEDEGAGKGKAGAGKQNQQQESDGDEQLRRLDAREARMAMRDALGGATSGWSQAEKDLAADLGKAQLPGLLETDDPDEAGSKAARAGVEKVTALRTEIEKALIAKLKKRKMLVEGSGPGGGSPSGQRQPSGTNTSQQMTRAKERAAQLNAAAGIKTSA